MSDLIGIDFGTAYTRVANMTDTIEIIHDSWGNNAFPSVVACTHLGQWLTGHTALLQAGHNPEQTFFSIKNLLGSGLEIEVRGQKIQPYEIISYFFEQIKKDTEAALGRAVDEVVLSYPAYFSRKQVMELRKAAELAYFKVKDAMTATDAIAFYYCHPLPFQEDEDAHIAIVDISAGSCSLNVFSSDMQMMEMKANKGTAAIGGNVVNKILSDYFVSKFEKMHGLSIRGDVSCYMDIFNAAELAKVVLSKVTYHQVFVANVATRANGNQVDMNFKFSVMEMEDLLQDMRKELVSMIEDTFRESNYTVTDMQILILSGGSMCLPLFRSAIVNIFHKGIKIVEMNRDAVARGNAIRAAVLLGRVKDFISLPCCPFSIGVMGLGDVFYPMIPQYSTVPMRRDETFSLKHSPDLRLIEIHVFEGNAPVASQNTFLGTVILSYRQQEKEVVLSFITDMYNSTITVKARYPSDEKGTEMVFPIDYRLPDARKLDSILIEIDDPDTDA